MHNARIVQFDRLIDVCHSHTKGDTDNVYNSRRLQSLMSLYGRDLSATVLLVGRDPLYHLHSNTDFYRLCERSAELHFDNLSEQLKKVVSLVNNLFTRIKNFNLYFRSVRLTKVAKHSIQHSNLLTMLTN